MNRTTEAEVIDVRSERRDRRARSLLEMLFVLTLRPCERCGAFEEDPDLRDREGGMLSTPPDTAEYTVSTRCRTCRAWRQVVSHTVPDPDIPVTSTELGGEGPSQILAPEDFLREIHRLEQDIAEVPSALPYTRWPRASHCVRRALLCVNELSRFPLAAQNGPLGKDAVVALKDRLHVLSERYDDDFSRYLAEREAAEGPEKMPVGDITRESTRAHDLWHSRGQVGEGRMVLKHQGFRERRLPALPGSSWEDVELVQVDANLTNFEGAEMDATTWNESRLQMSRFERVLLTKTRFIECDLVAARFYYADITDGVFDECDLDSSIWISARCERVLFKSCELLNAHFDDAIFKGCIFSKHQLGATERFAHLATTRGARFEDCDLRETDWFGRDLSGATFVRCKLAGAKGRPAAMEGVQLEGCDVSEDELRQMLAR